MIIRKTFSFTEDDKDVIEHLESLDKGSRSAYVARLIRQDMNGSKLDERIRTIVKELMQQQPNAEIKNELMGVFGEDDEMG